MAYADLLLQDIGKVKTIFPNGLRADLVDEETVDGLVATGMYYASLALESGVPRIQEFMGKRLDIPKFQKAAAICAERHVFTNGFVMLGFPTETAEEIEETIRVASESKLHIASFFRVTPFPGTSLHEYVSTNSPEKLVDLRYINMEYWCARVNLSTITDDAFEELLGKANRDFYLRSERIYRILRDYPKPLLLPTYLPTFLKRALTGIV